MSLAQESALPRLGKIRSIAPSVLSEAEIVGGHAVWIGRYVAAASSTTQAGVDHLRTNLGKKRLQVSAHLARIGQGKLLLLSMRG